MNAEDQKRLLQAADRSEITQVIYAYAENIDRRDIESLKTECFHPGARYQYTDAGEALTLDEFFATNGRLIQAFKQTQHYLSNISIRLDGDKAKAQTYLFAHHTQPAGAEHMPPLLPDIGKDYGILIGARYVDDFERRDGVWKIAFRKIYFEWESKIPLSDISGPYTQPPGKVISGVFG